MDKHRQSRRPALAFTALSIDEEENSGAWLVPRLLVHWDEHENDDPGQGGQLWALHCFRPGKG